MKTSNLSMRRSLLSLALLAAFAVPGVYAATITVNTFADGNESTCSLRDAVLSVNAGSDQGGCAAVDAYGTNDTINLPAGTYNLSKTGLDESWAGTAPDYIVVNTPDATKGDIDIMKSVRIVGAGSDKTTIQWDALVLDADRDRIFHIFTTSGVANVNVAIEGVTITGGRTFEDEIALGVLAQDPLDLALYDYYLRRAGGGLALGGAANVVFFDPTLEGADNANAGGLGGSTGGESGDTAYTLTLTDVIVDGNSAQGDGGGIYNAAPMTATNVIVRNNTSTTNGGGIYNEALTSITNSTISGNRADGGGGVFQTGAQPISFSGVTLSGNRAIGGGAISGRSGAAINMVNSTISGNLGEDVGAGLYTNSPATLRFVTIANNISGAESSTAGSGINVYPSGSVAVSLKNVLLYGNKRGWEFATYPDPVNDPTLPLANCGFTGSTMTITSLGNNLSSDATCATLVQGTDKNGVDPKIGALADNTGPTFTHALLAGSPALGSGAADATVTLDQRGIARDAIPDIGAYEEPTPVPPPGTTPTDGTTGTTDGGGGGGCTVNPSAQFEGGLLGLLAAAAGGLLMRRRRNGTRS